MSEKPKLQQIATDRIKIPPVRVTAVFDDDAREVFKASLEMDGIVDPLQLIDDGKELWLWDGLHRLEEAKLANQKSVPAIIRKGSLKDAMTKNLFWNDLRGRNRPGDEIRALKYLIDQEKMTLQEIIQKTPKKARHFEELFRIAQASPKLLHDLDEDLIKLGHATELSRLPNFDLQEKNLALVKIYQITVQDIHQHVDDVLDIIHKQAEQKAPTIQETAPRIDLIPCGFCEEKVTMDKIRGFNICMRCYYIAMEAIKTAKDKPTERELIVQKGANP
jgi:ParB family chromosome partitioning protein